MKKTILQVFIERLNQKKEELKKQQEYFQVITENEINTSCFERNAISYLQAMAELKIEIKEIEFTISLLSIQNNCNYDEINLLR